MGGGADRRSEGHERRVIFGYPPLARGVDVELCYKKPLHREGREFGPH